MAKFTARYELQQPHFSNGSRLQEIRSVLLDLATESEGESKLPSHFVKFQKHTHVNRC
jgi:hypothetical protein